MTQADAAFPSFRARAPWWGGDLQTLRNYVVGRTASELVDSGRQVTVPTRDGSGDQMLARVTKPLRATTADRPLVVLVHGLTGCEDSAYMRASAAFWMERGYRVARLNLRGAGPSRPLCQGYYFAGASHDLRDAIDGLINALAVENIVLVGFSLGGNIVAKYLAEIGAGRPGGNARIIAAALVSTPISLSDASKRLKAGRNWPYQRYLLGRLRRECLAAKGTLALEERRRIREANTLQAFDDGFTAPRHGFRDAEHYYDQCSAVRFLPAVRVPTLIVHARNDPWIPARPYEAFNWRANRALTPLLSAGGGHVGFHDGGAQASWHDRCVAVFVERQSVETSIG